MRRAWIAFAVLLLLAIPSYAHGPRSNTAAVTLVAHVAPVLRLQADLPAATGTTASIVTTGQNSFTLQFTPHDETALIEVPIVMRTNTNDVLLKASVDGATSGYIQMDSGAASASSITSRPMPLGPNVTFAIASGLFSTSTVGAPLPGTIVIAIPPAAVPDGKAVSVQITMEAFPQ